MTMAMTLIVGMMKIMIMNQVSPRLRGDVFRWINCTADNDVG